MKTLDYERQSFAPRRTRVRTTCAIALWALGSFVAAWGVLFLIHFFVPHERDIWGAEYHVLPIAVIAAIVGVIVFRLAFAVWRR